MRFSLTLCLTLQSDDIMQILSKNKYESENKKLC